MVMRYYSENWWFLLYVYILDDMKNPYIPYLKILSYGNIYSNKFNYYGSFN